MHVDLPLPSIDINMCLLQLFSLQIPTDGGFKDFTTEYYSQITEAFDKAYPLESDFTDIPKLIELKNKFQLSNSSKKGDEKDSSKIKYISIQIHYNVFDSPIAMAVILGMLGLLFLVSREYSANKIKKETRKVPIL